MSSSRFGGRVGVSRSGVSGRVGVSPSGVGGRVGVSRSGVSGRVGVSRSGVGSRVGVSSSGVGGRVGVSPSGVGNRVGVSPLVGVLALQGAFAAHAAILETVGARVREVRTAAQLAAVDGLVIPGGESTTISMLMERSGLLEPLQEQLNDGLAVLGTCAGMILLAAEIVDGRPDQHNLDMIDIVVRRNAYGTQVDSFEADIDVVGLDSPFHGVFIRAPVVERAGDSVEVLAQLDGQPVLCRSGSVTVASFHPELSGDSRIHARFLADL